MNPQTLEAVGPTLWAEGLVRQLAATFPARVRRALGASLAARRCKKRRGRGRGRNVRQGPSRRTCWLCLWRRYARVLAVPVDRSEAASAAPSSRHGAPSRCLQHAAPIRALAALCTISQSRRTAAGLRAHRRCPASCTGFAVRNPAAVPLNTQPTSMRGAV